jgi:hypothetical protein
MADSSIKPSLRRQPKNGFNRKEKSDACLSRRCARLKKEEIVNRTRYFGNRPLTRGDIFLGRLHERRNRHMPGVVRESDNSNIVRAAADGSSLMRNLGSARQQPAQSGLAGAAPIHYVQQ